MAEFKCTGDCIKCGPAQRIYCAAQRSYALLEMQQEILNQLADIRDSISHEGTVTPIDGTGTADAGVENRAS